jgi:hypothetical protein
MTIRTTAAPRVAFLVPLFLVVACGATVEQSAPASQRPSTTIEEPTLTPVPAGPSGPPAEPTEFVAPTPICPTPDGPVGVPDVTVSIADGPAVIATRGSSTFATCSTVATLDAAPADPPNGLSTHEGDHMTLALPPGWQFLRVEGFDHPAVGDGGNVWPPIDTPQRPATVDVPVPFRQGDSIADYNLTIVSADGSVVGTLAIRVRTSPGGG